MLVLWSRVSKLRYPHQCPTPLTTPAAQNGIQAICTNHITIPHPWNNHTSRHSNATMPSLQCGVYKLRSIQSVGVPLLKLLTIFVSLLASLYSQAPRHSTRSIPNTWGLCGSPGLSVTLWCFRCMATHWLVTMPVVSHSQARMKCSSTGWNTMLLWACARCRYRVTHTMVMCVITRVNKNSVID